MSTLSWIVVSGVAMSSIALVGSATLLLRPGQLQRLLLPLVAFAAGTLLGGALLHMLPAAIEIVGPRPSVFLWLLAGFTAFFALEQFLHWHHSHREIEGVEHRPLNYLVLIGDGLHNFIGGLGVAGVFLIDVRLGLTAWLAAVAHEIPQELGDFGVLIHGGWKRGQALLFNFLSGLAFLAGALVTWSASQAVDLTFLVPFAAGNFLYIGASDLVPEVNKHRSASTSAIHFVAFAAGLAILWILRTALEP